MTEPQPGPTTHKFAVVLNKKIPPAAALNACAHMTATLVARADDETRRHMSFVDYTDADGNAHPVSALSLVVLSARNSSQLRTARLDAIRAGLSHADFTETMTQDTFVEQMARTQAPMFVKASFGFGFSVVRPGDLLECWVRTRQG